MPPNAAPISLPPIVGAQAGDIPDQLIRPRRRPTEILPPLRPVAVAAYRLRRWVRWHTSKVRFALVRTATDLPVAVFRHSSPLLRQLGADQLWLQHNKVINLRLASARIDGVLIRPGETFSFCRLVGRTTRRRGYVNGMMIEGGETVPGVGGGICQLANMIHWMVLHSPLTVTERSTHSTDPFPDDGRTVPWGTGCTIFHNYVDLQVRNETATTYQLRATVGETHLQGWLRAASAQPDTYRVYARDERFLLLDGQYFRANQLWRDRTDRDGHTITELIKTNLARTMYDPSTLGTPRLGTPTLSTPRLSEPG